MIADTLTKYFEGITTVTKARPGLYLSTNESIIARALEDVGIRFTYEGELPVWETCDGVVGTAVLRP